MIIQAFLAALLTLTFTSVGCTSNSNATAPDAGGSRSGTGGSGAAGKAGTGATGGTAGAGAGGRGGTGAASGTGGTGTGGRGGTGGAGSAPTCSDYCTAIMKNCTGGDGSGNAGSPDATKTHQQYSAIDNCMAACSAFPVGALGDTAGNTLGCRLYHANAAASDAALHCPHAGPGGDGTCGAACDGYCQLTQKFCVGAAKIYQDDAACHARCATTADDIRFNVGTQDGNHVACLLYHAQEAPLEPSDHCNGDLAEGDAGPGGSITCM